MYSVFYVKYVKVHEHVSIWINTLHNGGWEYILSPLLINSNMEMNDFIKAKMIISFSILIDDIILFKTQFIWNLSHN